MLKKLIGPTDPVFALIPVLDEEFVSTDFHPALSELAALKKQIFAD